MDICTNITAIFARFYGINFDFYPLFFRLPPKNRFFLSFHSFF